MVGVARPPKRVVRGTTTKRIEFPDTEVVSSDGEVFENHYLKWSNDSRSVWVMLIAGNLELPDRKQIAAARLVFSVSDATVQAATKVGVVHLKEPIESGRSYDLKNLGDLISSIVIPKQPAAQPYEPPRRFSIDVSRAVKRIANGDSEFHGFALRTIQDRSVDDGWTVRLDVSKREPIVLEVDVYSR